MKIIALVYPGMTLLDLVGPMQTWSMIPGVEIQYVWKTAGPVVTDSQLPVVATHDLTTAWRDPDVVFVGGAAGPVRAVMGDADVLAFLADRGARAKWVASVCTGSLILGAAGLLNGYKAATHWSARGMLSQFGAVESTDRVCIDRNRMTGGGVTSGVDFGLVVAGAWVGDDTARALELILEYAPAPPYGTGRPELADPKTLAIAEEMTKAAFA
jgi:cyclohexyl-isocyanide hydratase